MTEFVTIYHPEIRNDAGDGPREAEIPNDPACIAVHEEAGWLVRPAPAADSPTFEPVVRYAPVDAEEDEPAKPKGRSKPSAD